MIALALARVHARGGRGPAGDGRLLRARSAPRPAPRPAPRLPRTDGTVRRGAAPGLGPGLVAAACACACACGRGADDAPAAATRAAEVEQPVAPTADEERPGGPDGAEVVFRPDGAPEARVAVEVARTRRELQRGLMYRTHLPPDAGMLFLFDRPEVQTFWMKNTLIPLDMIFVAPDMKVVGVAENAEPKTTIPRSLPGVVSQYVVEVNAGWARAHRVAKGAAVEFVRVPPRAPDEGHTD